MVLPQCRSLSHARLQSLQESSTSRLLFSSMRIQMMVKWRKLWPVYQISRDLSTLRNVSVLWADTQLIYTKHSNFQKSRRRHLFPVLSPSKPIYMQNSRIYSKNKNSINKIVRTCLFPKKTFPYSPQHSVPSYLNDDLFQKLVPHNSKLLIKFWKLWSENNATKIPDYFYCYYCYDDFWKNLGGSLYWFKKSY